jgi:hypothetical protein
LAELKSPAIDPREDQRFRDEIVDRLDWRLEKNRAAG